MMPHFVRDGWKKCEPRQYVARFVFGGTVTLVAGVVANYFGPEMGGLMLAFPALLPASLTLIKEHDGRARAIDAARGARLGSLALVTFGLVVWSTARSWPPAAVLGAATLAWIVVACSLWMVRYRSSVGR